MKEDSIPVDRGDEGIEIEWRASKVLVDSPDGAAPLIHIIARNIVGIVEAGNDDEEPREDGCDLVGPDDLGAVGLTRREWVVC